MKLWVDDVRKPPGADWYWAQSVNDAKAAILYAEIGLKGIDGLLRPTIELIDIDHDAGEYAQYGGDYIKLLDWLEETGRNYPIRIHSMNPVGVQNMRAIIQRNGWKEVK